MAQQQQQQQPLPRQFGKYVLLRKIAMGGMAEIFKAKTAGAEGFEKEIVIKRILPHFTEDESFVKMFIDEATITSKLQHSNIVQIFDFDVSEGSYYIAMEYIEGVDLKKAIDDGVKAGRPLSVAQCVYILMELSKGLHYAHTKEHKGKPLNIVHRDISPHNAMVSFNGEVKLMDFGIAKAAQRSTKTMAGTVKGKVAYMSPEQARGKPLDGRSDLFALGIMLWEMLTHRRLFLGDSDFETLTAVLKKEPPPPSSINPDVTKELDLIILKALEKDRDLRYPNVEAFNRELTRWYYSNVMDLDKEALKPWMQDMFAEDIERLRQFAAEERGGAAAAGGRAPARMPEPEPEENERTLALPAHYDPQQAATLLDDGSINQQQIRDAIAQQRQAQAGAPPPVDTGAEVRQSGTGTYSNMIPERSGKGWLIAALVILLLGGAGAAAFVLMNKSESPGDSGSVDEEQTQAMAELELRVDPPNAMVRVNGVLVDGRAADLTVGDVVTVVGSAPGYQRFEEQVRIQDPRQVFEVALEREAQQTSLLIEAIGDGEAVIRVAGQVLGPSPQSFRGDEGQSYEVQILPSGGGEPITRTVALDASNPVLKIEVPPTPRPQVQLVVNLEPPGTEVTADKGTVSYSEDGAQAIVSGLTLEESVTVAGSRAGYEDASETFEVAADGQEVALELRRAGRATAATQATGSGKVSINARPWANVAINGRDHGTTPQEVELPAGRHRVELTRDGETVTRTVTVRAGATANVTHDFTN